MKDKRLLFYLELLLSSPHNLISKKGDPEFHLQDSLAPFKQSNLLADVSCALDIGSGGGFPVIPLAIVYPHIEWVALEARDKKVEFLNLCKAELHLQNLQVIKGRAEILGKSSAYREKFDLVLSRAFAHARIFVELGAPFSKVDGKLITYKTKLQAETELQQIKEFLPEIKCKFQGILPYEFSCSGKLYTFTLLVFQKESLTPANFPHSWKNLQNRLKKILDTR